MSLVVAEFLVFHIIECLNPKCKKEVYSIDKVCKYCGELLTPSPWIKNKNELGVSKDGLAGVLMTEANQLMNLLLEKGRELMAAPEFQHMNAVTACLVLIGAFNWLKSEISDPFNLILLKAKNFFPDDSAIQNFCPLALDPPQSFGPDDIPLFWKLCGDARRAMEKLISLLSCHR